MRVALVSLDQRWQDKPANLERCRGFVRKAKTKLCQLVVFPEMTLTGYSLDVVALAEHPDASRTMVGLAKLATEYDAHIVFGLCLKQAQDNRASNVLCHARPGQGAAAVYSKVHPFSFAREERVIAPGNALGLVDIPDFRLGASICYDLRFPVPFALMAPVCAGAVCIANWPAARVNQWCALMVARAIENQMFMIGVNRIGTDGNGLTYVKSSMLVAPDGQVIEPIIPGEEMDIYEIDTEATGQYRAAFPTLQDANFERYLQLRDTLMTGKYYGDDQATQ